MKSKFTNKFIITNSILLYLTSSILPYLSLIKVYYPIFFSSSLSFILYIMNVLMHACTHARTHTYMHLKLIHPEKIEHFLLHIKHTYTHMGTINSILTDCGTTFFANWPVIGWKLENLQSMYVCVFVDIVACACREYSCVLLLIGNFVNLMR